MSRFILAAVTALPFCTPAAAQGLAHCPLTYEIFEHVVPHLDLQACPRDLARDGAFCRASAGHDDLHVFVFAERGDQCLLSSKRYGPGEYEFVIK